MKKILFLLMVMGAMALFAGYYTTAVMSNVKGKEPILIKIRKGDSWAVVQEQLISSQQIKHPLLIEPIVRVLKYDQYIKPGRYLISPGSSTLSMIRKLRSGAQDPINLTINNITFLHQLAGRVAAKLDIDSTEFVQVLYDAEIAANYGFTSENFAVMFLSNTYSVFWNISQEDFLERMKLEYNKFWTSDRKEKARQLQLTDAEVIILASIVQKETNYSAEYRRVAGVYLNRINYGMPLQADPTVKFALGDMTIRRILSKDLSVDSHYNTYKYKGLPPGPICLPEINVIEAVLNAENHNYLYFCAEYGSGRHAFASSYQEHMVNARKYQQALNSDKIFR